jgi:Protein of unknown function (DUF4012)
MSEPPKAGNLFKKPFPLTDKEHNAANKSKQQQDQDQQSSSGRQDQQKEIVDHETVPTPSVPKSASLPDLSNKPSNSQVDITELGTAKVPGIPAPPNSPRKSGSLFITGGLNRGVSSTGIPRKIEERSSLNASPTQSGNQAYMPGVSALGYRPMPAVTTIQATPPTINMHPTPKPKGFIRRTRAKYNSLSKRRKIVLAILALCMLFPTAMIILEGLNAVTIYSQAKSGIQHVMNVKNLFTGSGGHASNLLDVNKLNQAQQELEAAHSDFLQLSNNLDQDGVVGLAGGLFPQQVQTIRALSHIGADATAIGIHLMGTGKTLAPIFHDPITKVSNKPLITQNVMDIIKANIDYLLPQLDSMMPYTHNLDLSVLPISDQQKQQIATFLPLFPQARSDLAQAETFLGAISWIIGVDAPRTFLVQTMDRAELRAGGGFTGQFGTLNLNGGRMAPFNLQNIGPIEENNPTAITNGNRPPVPFTWWPIGNFGLRDSNLSADFPTSAKISIDLAKFEFQENIDGVIVFSPFLISHVLEITGPITIPKYNETITAQNLEARLHFYQLDNTGIYKEEVVENVQDQDIARKLFTKALANILLQHVLKAPPDELLSLAKEMLYAMQTKDLQIYVTNNQVEQLLAKYGSTSQIDTSPDHDGLFVVQSNVSVSKASQYVQTSIQDSVTLDADGGATHAMNLRLTYTMEGSVYGWDYYRDYVRIYVPPNSQFLWGNGFSAHYQPYCGSLTPLTGYRPCQTDVYGDGTLICPPNVDAGDGVSILDNPNPLGDQPVYQVGPPTNTDSDMPGRAMYGGWVNIPKNCTMNVALSWHVPPQGNHPYSLMFQRQSSTFPNVDLTILPTPGDCTKLHTGGLYFNGVMSGADTLFTPTQMKGGTSTNTACYPDTQV